ncbi:GRAM domain-containing protein [Paenibacillus pini]|uniref:GRAM domain-containing protein n=2 Tax=Paenibacillus TaxID=44249 RepID=W7YV93_9BACL|nr:hypothetical protein JCM16418_2608 [Paenibacillus pini JCM 16418]
MQMKTTGEILLTKPANLFRGMEAVGGKLKITGDRVIFNATRLNVQRDSLEIPMSDIQEVERRNTLRIVPNGITIKLRSGKEYRFVIKDRDQVIELIHNKIGK